MTSFYGLYWLHYMASVRHTPRPLLAIHLASTVLAHPIAHSSPTLWSLSALPTAVNPVVSYGSLNYGLSWPHSLASTSPPHRLYWRHYMASFGTIFGLYWPRAMAPTQNHSLVSIGQVYDLLLLHPVLVRGPILWALLAKTMTSYCCTLWWLGAPSCGLYWPGLWPLIAAPCVS
jgi:hypothetical protein